MATEPRTSLEQTSTEGNSTEVNSLEKDEAPAQEKDVATTQEKKEATTPEKEQVAPQQKGEATSQEKEASSPANDEEDKDGNHYLVGLPRIILTFGLCVTTFLVGLDQLIIATAIPKITDRFHSLDDVGWYGSAYLLCTTSLQPTFGKVYTYFDVKWTYVAALFVFEIGSVLCAAATNSEMFIVGRAVSGAGAAGLFGGSMTIIAYAVPLRQRSIYMACMSSMFGIASIVGPILGGVFTDRLSWRWCFWINLPFGGLGLAIIIFLFKSPKREYSDTPLRQKLKYLDFPGAFFLITGIICLLLALQWGGSTYSWKNSRVWGCLLGFGLLMLIFIGIQIRGGEHATIPARFIKQRTVLASSLTLCWLSMGLFTHIFYLPFYFQSVKGTTAEQSGIRCIPYVLAQTLGAIITGALVTVVGYYTPFIFIGSALFAVGSGLIYTLSPSSPRAQWIGYQVLAGFGAGSCVQLPFIAVQVVLSSKEMPLGNSVAIFFNTIGGAIAISIAQNIFQNKLVKEIPKYVKSVEVETVIRAGASGFRNVIAWGEIQGAILAYNKAITSAFILAIAVAGLAFMSTFLFEWKSVKGKKVDMAAGGA